MAHQPHPGRQFRTRNYEGAKTRSRKCITIGPATIACRSLFPTTCDLRRATCNLQPAETDMATNPFVTSTAVRTQNLFFGRQDEIKQLYGAVGAAPPQHCAVIGLPKSGKSSLLMALANADTQKQFLADPAQFLFVPVDCSVAHLDAPADLYVQLLERIAIACGKAVGGGD